MDGISINLQGLAIGLSTFLIIGLFHPLVIKGEYYFGRRVNRAFLAAGIVSLAGALICRSLFWSAILAVLAFSCFWSILEVNHQVRRVEKGWFPMNPRRRHEYKISLEGDNVGKEEKESLHVSQRADLINQHINN